MPNGNEQRVLHALGDLCNGTLDDRESDWLAGQLRESAEVRNLYVDYMSMHAGISSEIALLDPVVMEAAFGDEFPTDSLASVPRDPEAQAASMAFGRSWLAIAASLLFVFLLGGLLSRAMITPEGSGSLHASGSSDLPSIARITSTQDCRWGHVSSDSGSSDIGYGSKLYAGQTIQLREGLAEITFEDGATMLLESPAKVFFESDEQIEILEGRLAARIPPESRRLSIQTKTLDLRNVDAEFGLLTRDTGASELHVFNGSLEANFLDASGRLREYKEIHGSEAVLASPSTTTILEFPANDARFVRSMTPAQGPHDGLLAYEGFVYPEGPLSAQNGGFGWAGPWSTIAADHEAGPDSNRVNARSLSYNGIVPRGNHAAIVAQRNRIRRSLASSVGGVFDVAGLVENLDGVRLVGRDGTTIYLSFMQRVDKADDGFYGMELHRGDGNNNRVLCIGNGADETGYGVTSAVNIYGKANFPSLGSENTNENLFVVKIAFGSNNRDTVEVFRNPVSLRDEQKCEPDAVLKGNFAFDRISLANFDGSKIHEVDEIRIGTHFLAVTGRWGGERGRLLRGLTQMDVPMEYFSKGTSEQGFTSISRKLFPLGVIPH